MSQNLCEPNPCKNNGFCNVKYIGLQPTLECLCTGEYFGNYCEKVRETCRNRMCMNGGTCVELNLTTTQCQCPRGFFGLNCENGEFLIRLKQKLNSFVICVLFV